MHVRLEGLDEEIRIKAVYVAVSRPDGCPLFTVRGVRCGCDGFEDFIEIRSFGNLEDSLDFSDLLSGCLEAELINTSIDGSSVSFELAVEQGEVEPC